MSDAARIAPVRQGVSRLFDAEHGQDRMQCPISSFMGAAHNLGYHRSTRPQRPDFERGQRETRKSVAQVTVSEIENTQAARSYNTACSISSSLSS